MGSWPSWPASGFLPSSPWRETVRARRLRCPLRNMIRFLFVVFRLRRLRVLRRRFLCVILIIMCVCFVVVRLRLLLRRLLLPRLVRIRNFRILCILLCLRAHRRLDSVFLLIICLVVFLLKQNNTCRDLAELFS